MKVYTYYEQLNHVGRFLRQNELIDLWKKSWKLNGFDPVVLSREDAMKSDVYTEYYDFVQRVNNKISGESLPEEGYWLAAQLEIAAFTTIEKFGFISDYDVINYNFKPCVPKEELHWLNGECSCFAFGSSAGWYNYIETLFKNEDEIVSFCKSKFYEKDGRLHFGDQDFLQAIVNTKTKDTWGFKVTHDTSLAQMYFPNNDIEQNKTYHLSHNNIHQAKQKLPNKYHNMSQDDIRIECAEEIINKIKQPLQTNNPQIEIWNKFALISDDTHFTKWVKEHGDVSFGHHVAKYKKYIPHGGVVIDGGANIGTYSAAFCKLVGDEGRVYSFEPNPPAFTCLYINAPKAKKFMFALGEKDGFCDMATNLNYGASHLKEGNNIAIRPLDFLNLDRCDFIKLDLEGYELFALKGATETIKKYRPVLALEVSPNHMSRFDITPNELYEYLDSIDYGVVEKSGIEEQLDILCLPKYKN